MLASQTVLASLFNTSGGYNMYPMPPGANMASTATYRDLYAILLAFYMTNGLYDDMSRMLAAGGNPAEAMKPLRNPAYRIVEFYVAKVWPGNLPEALPIVSDNQNIEEPIKLIWKWSNWSAKKQVATRQCSMFGDMFIKVCSRPANTSAGAEARVWLDLIKPEYVTEFETDEHGAYLTYVKIDVPHNVTVDSEGNTKIRWYTEVWSKDDQLFRSWTHDHGPDALIKRLGTPDVSMSMAGQMGIDFIPIAHAKFKDIGDDRGIGAFTLSLDKINEVNRKATRLSQMLFRHNKALWAITANALDKEGRPIPAPRFAGDSVSQAVPTSTYNRSGLSDHLAMDDGDILRLSGMSDIKSLVPAINYEAARAIIQDDLLELEYDQPEMAYYRLVSLPGEMSGRALRFRLASAIDRVLEARGNMEAALILAHQMALTIGKLVGSFNSSIGNFETGDFDHSFAPREVISTNDLEDAMARKTNAEAATAMQTAGVSKRESLMENFGYGEDEVQRIMDEATVDAKAAIEAAQAAFNAGAGDPTQPVASGADAGGSNPPFGGNSGSA